MTSFFVVATGSLSIAIAATIAFIRFWIIHASFRPFAIIVVASLINEVISITLIYNHQSNAVNTNLLSLAEGMLWCWQFGKWQAFKNNGVIKSVAGCLLITWLIENIVFEKLFMFSSTYSIILSLVIVLFSVNIMNRQIAEENGRLLTNPKFIICAGNIVFSTYRIVVECFYLLDINSTVFLANIFTILVVVNVFVNLLYALAALWIPTRLKFTLPFSSLQASSA